MNRQAVEALLDLILPIHANAKDLSIRFAALEATLEKAEPKMFEDYRRELESMRRSAPSLPLTFVNELRQKLLQ